MNDIPQQTVPPDLIRPGTAAKLLGVHKATICRWILKGRLASFHVGPQVRVSKADVLAMVKPREAPKGTPRAESAHTRREQERWANEVLARHGL